MPHRPCRSISRSIVLGAILTLAGAASAQQTATPPPPARQPPPGVEKSVIMKQKTDSWLEVVLKASSMLFDPETGAGQFVMDSDVTTGVVSPDGKRIAYIASDPERVKDGHDFDLFVADIDPGQPSGKSNIRRLTTDQERPVQALWLPDASGIAFQAGEERSLQVWHVDLAPDSKPVRLSDRQQRCSDLSVTPAGEIAYIVHKGSQNKQQFKDLVIRPAPGPRLRSEGGGMRLVLQDQHISGYAISPDGKTLAWSGLGSMFLVSLDSGDSKEIPLHGVHRQLLNHSVYQFAWRPDGKVIAIQCGFLGGISRGPNTDPNEPWPRMFAEDKVFFVPVDWTPTAEDLTIGENFPSPTADDPKAEISPLAGDRSKPWWVREIPVRPLALKWVSADDATRRIAEHPAPPEQREERRMPPLPRTPPGG